MESSSSLVKDLPSGFTQQDIEEVFSRIRLFPEYFDLSGIVGDTCTELSIITQRVSELMKRAGPLFIPTDPKDVLRRPYRFFQLMESLHFENLNMYDRLSPDEADLQQKEVADYAAQTRTFNKALLQEGKRLCLPRVEWFRSLWKKVPDAQEPFPPLPLLIRTVQICSKCTEERGLLFETVRSSPSSSITEKDFFDLEGRDARRLFRLASSFPEYFDGLPSEENALKDYENKKATVRTLCQCVETLMKQAPFPFEGSPETVLRTPYRFFRLMQSLYFADIAPERYARYTAQEADQRCKDIIKYAKHTMDSNRITLQVATLSFPRRAKTLNSLQEQISALFQNLFQNPSRSLLEWVVELCTTSVEERGCLQLTHRPGEPLLAFERKALERALSLARTFPEHFSSILPENNPLYRILDGENTRIVLSELEDRTSEHIKKAESLGFPHIGPKEVLQEASRFFRLVESLRFVKYTEDKQEELLRYAKQALSINQSVLQLAERLSVSETSISLFPAQNKLSSLLEETPVHSAEIIEWCLAMVEDRGDLYPAIQKAIEEQLKNLESFSGPLTRFSRIFIFETSLQVPIESRWIQLANEHLDMIEPLLMIIPEVQKFLQPYLDGIITAETENISRPEIISWLPKKIREKFPRIFLSSGEVETIAMTAYLRMGFSHFHLERQKENFSYTEQRNREESFIQALMHALPIDFRSAHLSPKDIRELTATFLDDPEAPISAEWLNGRRT